MTTTETPFEPPKGNELLEIYFRWCHRYALDTGRDLQRLLLSRAIWAWFKVTISYNEPSLIEALMRCKLTAWDYSVLQDLREGKMAFRYPKILLENVRKNAN